MGEGNENCENYTKKCLKTCTCQNRHDDYINNDAVVMTHRIYGEKQELYTAFRLENTMKRAVCKAAMLLCVLLILHM